MGVNKDNGVRTGSMTGGGSSRIKVIEAAGTAARFLVADRCHSSPSGCHRYVADQQDIKQWNHEGWLPISSAGCCMYTLT